MEPSLLEVEDLRKVYSVRDGSGRHEQLVALAGLSFCLERSESLAIVGESGSGKSTTARLIAGLESPSFGSIRINGEVRKASPWPRATRRRMARQVQMVFQDPNSSLDPSQTVRQSLQEVLTCHFAEESSSQDARLSELLEQVGLDELRHADRRPGFLSGGERQRVAIARALAAQPELLVLDEAVSALDVSVQAHVLNLLAELRSSLGITYLFISHDLAVIRQVSSQCIVMHRGVEIERGKTEEVLDSPNAEYTRQLLSAIPRPNWKPQRTPQTSD